MAQDVSSAADTLKERAKHTVLLKKPSIVHSYAEGGGVLGKMFPVFGNDWEEKTGIPLGFAIHVKEGVSTGLPFMTAISYPHPTDPTRPMFTCKDIMRMYDDDCAEMFQQKPRRLFNLLASNGINLAQRILNPVHSREDRANIELIKRHCDMLLDEVPDDRKNHVQSLRERASMIWMTKSNQDAALRLVDKIRKEVIANPKKKIEGYKPTQKTIEYLDKIGTLIGRRSVGQKGLLSTLFMRSVLFSMDQSKKFLGPRENRFHNPLVKQDIFQMRMKDNTMDQVVGSIYTAAYSPKKGGIVYFYARRDDLLDMSPTAPSTVSHPGMKLWDANMATTANLLAFPPHITEDGILTIDKATIHTPGFVISQIEKYKPQDMGIVSITLSTGHLTSHAQGGEEMYEFYAENGEVGNDHFLEDSKAYTTTAAHMDIATRIGEENIFYISPRMNWKTHEEMISFPSPNEIMNASPENMAKIQKRAEKYLADKADMFNRIWQTLADNMYMLGHIDKPKFDEITERLGVKAKLEQEAALRGNIVQMPTNPPEITAANLPPSLKPQVA